MNTNTQTAKKFGLVGAGIGLTLFALIGLLQGSLIGGAIGLGIVNTVFNEAAGPSLLSRVIVAASMLAGVIVSGIICVGVCSATAWMAGYVVGWMANPKMEATDLKEHGGNVR